MTQGTFPNNNQSFRSYRFAPDFPAFAGRDLTPGDRLELDPDPLPQACMATTSPASTQPLTATYPNPCQDQLQLTAPIGATWELRDAIGRPLLTGKMQQENASLDLAHLIPGIYWIKISTRTSTQVHTVVKQ